MNRKDIYLSPAKQALFQKWKDGKFQSAIIPKRLASENIPLSFSQQRLWFVDQLYHGSSFYNIPIAFHIKGVLNIAALHHSLNEILRRHEAWRTTFTLDDSEPVQRVQATLSWELPIVSLEDLVGENQEFEVKQLAAKVARQPFNLSKGPMVRGTLLCLNSEEHILLIVMHHIVTDGWSCGVFLRELSRLYAAFSNHQPSPLTELPIQYGDFAVWQRDRIQGDFLARQLSYWRQQLAGDLPALNLPTDRPRPAIPTFAGAKEHFTFPKSLADTLKHLSQHEDATLFMGLLAAFNVLLYRYTNQDDILIGSPIANRSRPELEGVLGLFVNTLILRNNLKGNPSFREFLRRVRDVTLNAYAHQDLPFEKLVEELQPEQDLSRNPLYEVMVVLQNSPVSAQEVSGLTLSPLELDSGTAQLDLFLSMSESPKGLVGYLEYNTDIFEAATIQQLLKNFHALLESIITNPEQKINELSLPTLSEQKHLLIDLNQTEAAYPRHGSLAQLFEKQVEKNPDTPALIDQGEAVTYDQLNRRANQLSHYLQKQGVTQGTLLAICLGRSVEAVVGILAVLKAGGAYIPLDPSYPADRLNFMLCDSQAEILITQAPTLSILANFSGTAICLDSDEDAIAQTSRVNPDPPPEPANLAYVIYTSGSTGTPKGVLGTHRGIVNGLTWLWKTYPFVPGEVCCQKTALSFVDSIWELFAPLLQGVPTVIIRDAVLLDPQQFLNTLAHYQVSRIILVPSLLRLLLDNYSHLIRKASQLNTWIVSGEALSLQLVQTFRKTRPTARLINLYGSSEVSANATCFDISLLPDQATRVPIGRPISNTKVYVLTRELQPVPVGVTGELYISGEGLAQGYWRHPQLTQERFLDHPFIPEEKLYKTGDLVRYARDGNLEYLGRCDEQIKIRGFRIELGEITTVITQYPEVRDSVVLVSEEAQGEQRLIAYIVPKEGSQNITAALLACLQEKLPSYMVPSAFVIVDALPLTPSGKVDKRSLLTHRAPQVNPAQSFVAPRNFTELTLVKLWESLLETHPIGVTDNFFNVGGHSFLAVRLAARIQDQFSHHISLSTLFENPTIEKLANIVRQPARQHSYSHLVAINAASASSPTPPFFCIHGAGGGINNYFKLSRRLGETYPFYGLEHTVGEDGLETLAVEEAASRYLQEIQAIQSDGPYLLGGHCYGGVLAFEIAQQLQKQGQTVALLAVIDTIIPETPIEPSKDDDAKFLLRMAKAVKTNHNVDFSLPFEELRDLTLEAQFHLVNQKANFIFSDTEINDFIRYYRLFKSHVQAMRAYVPQVYPGTMALFRAQKKIIHEFNNPEWDTDDPLLGWSEYTSQPIHVIEVPGDHFSMFVEPHIQVLTEHLKNCINTAVYSLNKQ